MKTKIGTVDGMPGLWVNAEDSEEEEKITCLRQRVAELEDERTKQANPEAIRMLQRAIADNEKDAHLLSTAEQRVAELEDTLSFYDRKCPECHSHLGLLKVCPMCELREDRDALRQRVAELEAADRAEVKRSHEATSPQPADDCVRASAQPVPDDD